MASLHAASLGVIITSAEISRAHHDFRSTNMMKRRSLPVVLRNGPHLRRGGGTLTSAAAMQRRDACSFHRFVCRAAAFEASKESEVTPAAEDMPVEMLDTIINIFKERPDQSDWPKLMAFSHEWPVLGKRVLERLNQNADACEDSDKKMELLKMLRELRKVDDEIGSYHSLLKTLREIPPQDLEGQIAHKRRQIGPAFLQYVAWRVDAHADDEKERQELQALALRVATLCDALDQAAEDMQQADEAAGTMEKLMSVDTMEDADKMIDDMAQQGQITPALMLTAAKMYNSVKESQYTADEIKDVMAHLYFKMKETSARQQPPDVRILKHLLSMEDPLERRDALAAAFTPAPPMTTPTEDYLSTTPDSLLKVIQTIISAYTAQKNTTTMTGQAAGMMNPEVIETMRLIEAEIEKDYM